MNSILYRFVRVLALTAGFAFSSAFAQNLSTPLAPPAAALGPRVALETRLGRIVVELYPEKAPRTVENFLSYVRDGHYNGSVFHRVIANLLIQGGAFTPDLQQKPERATVVNEADNGLSNLRGTLASARRPGEKDSGGAQFFINTVDNRQFDHRSSANAYASGYCVFGRVLEGMDVVDKIRALPTGPKAPFAADVPKIPVVIERVELLEE
jgi:cyclophilin family peptidyl-prolyl cis-trans isomerase